MPFFLLALRRKCGLGKYPNGDNNVSDANQKIIPTDLKDERSGRGPSPPIIEETPSS